LEQLWVWIKQNGAPTFEVLKHFLSLLVAAELDEALQHAHGVVSKRHLEAAEHARMINPTV